FSFLSFFLFFFFHCSVHPLYLHSFPTRRSSDLKSLWASIGFHLGYLMVARFIIHSKTYGVPAIVAYQNNIAPGFGESLLTIAIIPGTIGILLVLLLVRRFKK